MSPAAVEEASGGRTRFRHADELQLDREILALRLVLVARVLFVLTTVASTVFIGKSFLEKTTTATLSLLAIGPAPVYWWLLNQRRSVTFVGVMGLVTDVLIINALPFVWYLSVGGEEVLPAYLVKHPNTLVIAFAMIAGHSLAGRPGYPAGMTAGVLVHYVAVIVFALGDPRTEISSDFVGHMTGPSISVELFSICLLTLVSAGGMLTWIAWRTQSNLRRAVSMEIRGAALSRYFSPGTQEEILRQAENPLGQQAQRQDIAVLFSDLRGFTALSETAAPEEVMGWLREYHEAAVAAVFAHGGTLDKFLGDGMLATFGVPTPTGDEATRAVRAALGVREALTALNASRVARGLPEFKQGIGIHFGPAIVGNVGVPDRLEYTVVGDTVNVASRLEGLCKPLHHSLLLSDAVHGRLPAELASSFRQIGRHTVRGRSQPILLYTPVDDRRTGQIAALEDESATELLTGEFEPTSERDLTPD